MFSASVKGMFFDGQRVIRSVDAATRKVLSKFGAFTRQRARSSIRKRKRPADPGSPPSSHVGTLRTILFGFDPVRRSVVIGPVRAGKAGVATGVLEKGGTETLFKRGKAVKAHYRAFPYMGPAFAEELKKMPAMWQGAVKP
jgi:hypothetical protein